jgi:hypothetical protein
VLIRSYLYSSPGTGSVHIIYWPTFSFVLLWSELSLHTKSYKNAVILVFIGISEWVQKLFASI